MRRRSAVLCAVLVLGVGVARHPQDALGAARALAARAGLRAHALPAETLLRDVDAAAAAGRHAEEARLCELLYTQHRDHPMAQAACLRAMRAHMQAGDAGAAQRDLERYRALYPESPLLPEALLDLAGWQYESGEFVSAASTYTDLIALVTRGDKPSSGEDTAPAPPIWNTLRSWSEHQRQVRSREQLERLARFNQALCYVRGGDRESALRAYDRFLCRFPRDERAAEANFQIAVLQQDAGDLENALQHFRAVFAAADPQASGVAFRSESIYRSGRILESMRRFEDAAEVYRLALLLRPAGDEHRLASMAALAHLVEEEEPLRALDIYREIAERSTQPAWRAVALERMAALENESTVAAAGR